MENSFGNPSGTLATFYDHLSYILTFFQLNFRFSSNAAIFGPTDHSILPCRPSHGFSSGPRALWFTFHPFYSLSKPLCGHQLICRFTHLKRPISDLPRLPFHPPPHRPLYTHQQPILQPQLHHLPFPNVNAVAQKGA
jgi:hypothetical protein